MKSENTRTLWQRHKLKLAGLAIALVALKGVAETLPNPTARLQDNVDRIEASLSLSDTQAELWASAETATLEQLKAGFERRKTMRDTVRDTLAANQPDLHALSETILADVDAHVAEQKASHAAWLKLYDSLSTEQQASARDALLEELTKLERRHRMGPPSHEGRRQGASASSF